MPNFWLLNYAHNSEVKVAVSWSEFFLAFVAFGGSGRRFSLRQLHMANVISRQHQHPDYRKRMQMCLKYQTFLPPGAHLFLGGEVCMTPAPNRHVMRPIYILIPSPPWQWEWGGEARGRSLPQMLIFSQLVWGAARRGWRAERGVFDTMVSDSGLWCLSSQANSVAPAGDAQTETQTDCYQTCVAISVFLGERHGS